MKVCIVADLHGNLPEIPEHDLLLVAGDIFPGRSIRDDSTWAGRYLQPWLCKQCMPIFLEGNHDFNYINYRSQFPDLDWTVLRDSMIEINGLRIYGTGWTNPIDLNHDRVSNWWGHLADEAKLEFIFKNIPEKVDILITHSPPFGILDEFDGQHYGSPSLLQQVKVKRPRYHIYGHLHCQKDRIIKTEHTTFINASLCDNNNKLINEPIVIEI
mgnify:CR=1 FL=1